MSVLNTHILYNELKMSGFKEDQAEAVIKAINTIQTAQLEDVATKNDIVELKAEIAELRTEFRTDISSLKSDIKITHWGIALILIVIGIPALKTLFTG